MATFSSSSRTTGYPINKPPMFDGNDYCYWKIRMRVYLQSVDYTLWDVVEKGPYVPSKYVDGKRVAKEILEYNEFDERYVSLNAKAMHNLYCALDQKEFIKIASCSSAQEIWKKLERIHEGTKQVKDYRIRTLVCSYDGFTMGDDESVSEMYTRFIDIINKLEFLGHKPYSEEDKVRKILQSLPRLWEDKKIEIVEGTDITKLSVEELIGSLLAFENFISGLK